MNIIEALKNNDPDSLNEWANIERKITSSPDVMDGLPVFAGTRIPVYIILDYLSEGYNIDDIKKDYPSLNNDQIHDALRFATMLATIH